MPPNCRLPRAPATCSKPSVTARATDGDSAAITVTAPGTGGQWARFNLTLYVLNGTVATDAVIKQTCAAATGAAVTACTVDGLDANTAYRVTALAEKTGKDGVAVIASPASDPQDLATPDNE